MQRGYIKTWRKAIDSGWLRNHRLWVFWSWCLLKASYKEYDLVVGCQKIHLMPGDFVFGRRVAASELNMSEREIRTAVDSLKTSRNIAVKTTNKYSIISVLNWDTYQQTENINDQQNDQQLTNKRPTTDHKQEVKNKRIKEYNISDLILPQNIKPETWSAYLEMRKVIKKPATLTAQKLVVKKLATLNGDPNVILEQSIQNSWQGVFEIKEAINAGTNTFKKPFRTERDAINQAAADEADIINRERADRIAREKKTASTG